jgi:Ca2+-transporting ATPase
MRWKPPCWCPGDIIFWRRRFGARGRVAFEKCANLKADESAMTDESVPVSKSGARNPAGLAALAPPKNMLISATALFQARAVAVVTATGMGTECGADCKPVMRRRIYAHPLQKRWPRFSQSLSFFCLGVCAECVWGGCCSARICGNVHDRVSLAVAAIPRVPAICPHRAGHGVQRMVKRTPSSKAAAVETLGCARPRHLLGKKRGTLTQYKMTVVEVW